jgi:hypothetical protein
MRAVNLQEWLKVTAGKEAAGFKIYCKRQEQLREARERKLMAAVNAEGEVLRRAEAGALAARYHAMLSKLVGFWSEPLCAASAGERRARELRANGGAPPPGPLQVSAPLHVEKFERHGLTAALPATTARQFLGLDIYQARCVSKRFGAECLAQLAQLYGDTRLRQQQGAQMRSRAEQAARSLSTHREGRAEQAKQARKKERRRRAPAPARCEELARAPAQAHVLNEQGREARERLAKAKQKAEAKAEAEGGLQAEGGGGEGGNGGGGGEKREEGLRGEGGEGAQGGAEGEGEKEEEEEDEDPRLAELRAAERLAMEQAWEQAVLERARPTEHSTAEFETALRQAAGEKAAADSGSAQTLGASARLVQLLRYVGLAPGLPSPLTLPRTGPSVTPDPPSHGAFRHP